MAAGNAGRLERRHVWSGIPEVNASGRVPAGACRQNAVRHPAHIGPAEFRQVLNDRRFDDAAANHFCSEMGFHCARVSGLC